MQTDVIFCILFSFIILLLIRFYSFYFSYFGGVKSDEVLLLQVPPFEMVIVHAPETSNQLEPRSFLFISPLAFFERRQENRAEGKKQIRKNSSPYIIVFFFVIFCFHSIRTRSSLQDAAVRKGPHQARTHAHQKIDVLRDVWKEDKESWRARRGTNESCGEVHVR